MPKGQSQTTWFPELKTILKTHWKHSLDIEGHFDLIKILNGKLKSIRIELDVKPPTFFCRNCNEFRESKLSMVTITSMYFALERFETITHKEHLELKRNWRKYSKEKSINIHGESIGEEIETRKNNRA